MTSIGLMWWGARVERLEVLEGRSPLEWINRAEVMH